MVANLEAQPPGQGLCDTFPCSLVLHPVGSLEYSQWCNCNTDGGELSLSSVQCSLVPTSHTPPSDKWSGERSWIPKIGKDQWDCEISNYYLALNFVSIQVSILFLCGLSANVLNVSLGYMPQNCALAQEIWRGSPDHFHSCEGGVWSRDNEKFN